ncbi:MAG: hypothetical protein ACREBF_05060 [Candidatus Micrarchaeales archaeon]
MNTNETNGRLLQFLSKSYIKALPITVFFLFRVAGASSVFTFNVIATLNSVQQLLTQIGPMLSAVLFIVAGVFYAVGQMLPPDKKANFHTTSVNIIIGAVMVAILSVASSGFALASTHLLVNMTNASVT